MFKKFLWLAALSGFLFATGAQAQAPDVLNPPTKTTKKKVKKSRTKFDSGSQETKKERVARLKRECKDQVNAGACTGYTR